MELQKADVHLDQLGRLDAPTHVLQGVPLRVGPGTALKAFDGCQWQQPYKALRDAAGAH